ncbi:MAG: hypothetical protein N2Z65_05075 [Clostridiales bacterium]|nr:hypothetical protein [Clostridiales bacterium]
MLGAFIWAAAVIVTVAVDAATPAAFRLGLASGAAAVAGFFGNDYTFRLAVKSKPF